MSTAARFGVEPNRKVLQYAPPAHQRHPARKRDRSLIGARARRDAELKPQIDYVWNANMHVYGADKVWMRLNREGSKRPANSSCQAG